MTNRAAIYARYSSDLQDKTSIDGQHRNCRERCAKLGYEVVLTLFDEAISGTDDNRPGFNLLKAALARRDVDVVVVDETSRLTRTPSTLLSFIDQLQFCNQALLDCKGFDSRDQNASLLAGLYGGMDRMELEKIRARTHRGLRERAERGNFAGGKTFGYRSVPEDPEDPRSERRLVIEPAEAKIVREIFALYADGMSPKSIANALNERRVPSPGSSWKRTQRRTAGWVHTVLCGTADRGTGMLRNELYVGKMIWNKRRSKKIPGTGRRVFEIRPESEWVTADAPELRIVSEAVWTRVQRRLMANRERSRERGGNAKGYHVSRYLLSGILKCAVCGSNFIMTNKVAYGCSSHTNGGQHCCSNRRLVRRDVIEPIVLLGVRQDLLSDEALAEVRSIVAEAQRGKRAQRTAAERDMRQTETAIDRLTDAIAEAGMSRALREKLRDLESKRDQMEARLRVSDVDDNAIEMLPRVIDRWRGLVDRMVDLARHEDARPEDVEEARERLSGLIGVQMIPENGELVAAVGLKALDEGGLYMPFLTEG